ncbi:hypothetical protein A3K78_00080 [Candidatus Bathyarchaeota archaeon RBG_13_52_12]|nr:MAG: hypothetical protein A3K78_00080 [Candidatus Bathyarchaeota archaeon RBG_13_52_12]
MSSVGPGERHSFSVELDDREHVKRFFILNDSGNRVLFEGYLIELKEISLVEGLILEVRGSNGILRIDMTEEELRRALVGKR